MAEKKKFPKVLFFVLLFLLLIILAFVGLFVFSKLDKKQSLSVFPHDYSIYLHTDSAWEAVEPMLDLKAVDMFLSSPELTSCRGIFMQLRASSWRNNKVLAKIAAKPIDFALYKNEEDNKFNFMACVDLGGLSSVTRFSSAYISKLDIKDLSQNEDFFVFSKNDANYFIKPYKNLLIVTDNQPLLEKAFLEDYNNYTKEELAIINKKTPNPIKIVANTRKLLANYIEDDGLIGQFTRVIPENGLCSLSFSLTDEKINLNACIPFLKIEDENYSLNKIFEKKSSTPSILSRFRENIQYYTIINAGTIQDLKDAVFPILVDNADDTWSKYNSVAKTVLSMTIDDLLFSWTGSEIAAFGIEGKNNPVFAIQIKDEHKRQEVFEKFLDSILIKDNSSLLLDGVRIPRLELPSFIQGLLDLFGVSLPSPYYLIQDGFIYFSESAENLSEIYKAEKRIDRISADSNWNSVSKELSSESTLSLYYNLDRSIPFFLRSKASLSNLLSLYSIGRCDFCIKESELTIKISAISNGNEKSNTIPGFPIDLQGRTDGKLYLRNNDSNAKNNSVYWVENGNVLCSMEIPSTEIKRKEFADNIFVSPSEGKKENESGKLWITTVHGEVYLLDTKLEALEGYPIFLGEDVENDTIASGDGLFVFTDSKKGYFIAKDQTIKQYDLNLSGSLKSTPTVYEDSVGRRFIGYYDKGFLGKLVVIADYGSEEIYTLNISGIGFGSPVFYSGKKGELPIVSFVTQNGDFYLWDLNTDTNTVYQLEGLYKTNPVCLDDSFVVVSTDGVVSKISLDGEKLDVQISNVTCNDAFVSVIDKNLYVCPDGNVVYAFDKNLELLYPFPITGWGIPVFADVNGDKMADCFTLSVDKKLHAIKMR